MARSIIIGDPHGCIDELDALLDELAPTAEDALLCVGDLVAKGPDSRAVVRRAREAGIRAVRGNHDERCLRWYRARREGRAGPPLKPHHRVVCDMLDEPDWAWLDALPYTIQLPSRNVLVVHAGLVPGRPLEEQHPQDMLTMRSIDAQGGASSRIDDGPPWASLWPGPEEVVFGHDAVRGLQRWPFATGIDTGCVYGGRLTAYVLPERKLVSVAARRVWSSAGTGAAPSEGT